MENDKSESSDIDSMFNKLEEEERAIQAGEKYRVFDLKRVIKDLEKDTSFTKLYTDKKDDSVLKDHIKTNLQKRKYEVTDGREEEILSKWKAINEPPIFDPQKPKEFKKWLDKNDLTWKDFTDKKGKRAYLNLNKKRFSLSNDAIRTIISLVPTKKQQQSQTKTTSAKQQISGGKPTTPALTINEIHKWRVEPRDGETANYIVVRIMNKHTGKEEDVTIKMTLNDQSRKIKEEYLQSVHLDLDTLMTEECYDSILQQSKSGGLPLLTVDDFKQVYEDLLANQSQFIYLKDDIYYKIAALYAIKTYFTDVFHTIGYGDISAPDLGWGKTQLMRVIVHSSFHSILDVDITPANIYRRMKYGIILTMGFDDLDNKYGKDTESGGLTSVVDSGYTRGASVPRFNLIKDITERFPTFGPKLWTRKSWIAQSVLSRSIPFPITKNLGRKDLKNRPPTPKDFEKIRDRLYLMRWSLMDEVKTVYNNLMNTKTLTGRIGEVFLPMLTIAKLIDEELYKEILRFITLHEEETNLETQNHMKIMMVQVLCEDIKFRGKVKGTEIVDSYNRKLAKEKYLPLNPDGQARDLTAQKVYPTLKSLNFKPRKGAGNAQYVNVDLEILEDLACGYNMKKLFDESEIYRKDIEKIREKTRKKLLAEGHTEEEIVKSEAFESAARKKLEEYYKWRGSFI